MRQVDRIGHWRNCNLRGLSAQSERPASIPCGPRRPRVHPPSDRSSIASFSCLPLPSAAAGAGAVGARCRAAQARSSCTATPITRARSCGSRRTRPAPCDVHWRTEHDGRRSRTRPRREAPIDDDVVVARLTGLVTGRARDLYAMTADGDRREGTLRTQPYWTKRARTRSDDHDRVRVVLLPRRRRPPLEREHVRRRLRDLRRHRGESARPDGVARRQPLLPARPTSSIPRRWPHRYRRQRTLRAAAAAADGHAARRDLGRSRLRPERRRHVVRDEGRVARAVPPLLGQSERTGCPTCPAFSVARAGATSRSVPARRPLVPLRQPDERRPRQDDVRRAAARVAAQRARSIRMRR